MSGDSFTKIHRTVCRECETEFYVSLPRDDTPPFERDRECPSCEVEFKMKYSKSDDPETAFHVEVEDL